jgi:hypothetical protein
VVVVKVAQRYSLPAQPVTPASAFQWSGRVLLAIWLVVWKAGTRDLRRRALSPERRTLALRYWNATSVAVTMPMLVMALTGQDSLWWMAALGALGVFATASAFTGMESTSQPPQP